MQQLMAVYCRRCGAEFVVGTKEELEDHVETECDCEDGDLLKPEKHIMSDGLTVDIVIT